MFASLFVSAFLATVMAQSSSDNSPITTVTLAASAILPPATTSSAAAVPTVTNTKAAVTTITISNTGVSTGVSTVASSQVTVLLTSTITSTLCGQCTTPTGAVTVAPVATSIRPSSSVVYSTRNATSSGVPYGGNAAFPVNAGTTLANGTIVSNSATMPSAGSLAISAGVVAASYFAFVL